MNDKIVVTRHINGILFPQDKLYFVHYTNDVIENILKELNTKTYGNNSTEYKSKVGS